MLSVDNVTGGYGEVLALFGVSFEVKRGEIVSIVGSNGAGKSTILRTISGLLRPQEGKISFEDMTISRMPPHQIVSRTRIAHVPEGRRLFQRMSVRQNLLLGAYTQRSHEARERELERIYGLFPILQERSSQLAGTLSGGEQQMLAIARGLMLKPQLLMLDEPSLGVMPTMVSKIFDTIRLIKDEEGLTILLVEQNVREALDLADRAYILQTGRIIASGTGAELLESDMVRKAYLGM